MKDKIFLVNSFELYGDDLKKTLTLYKDRESAIIDLLDNYIEIEGRFVERSGIIITSSFFDSESVEYQSLNMDKLFSYRNDEKGFENLPIVISNTCIGSCDAMMNGRVLLSSGIFNRIVILCFDFSNNFILSGLNGCNSKKELKPFVSNTGYFLTEALVILTLMREHETSKSFEILEVCAHNDSTNLLGLEKAEDILINIVNSALNRTRLKLRDIDYIVCGANGVAKNDNRIKNCILSFEDENKKILVPKQYLGHTLSCSPIIECLFVLTTFDTNNEIAVYYIDNKGKIKIMKEHLQKGTVLYISTAVGGMYSCIIMK